MGEHKHMLCLPKTHIESLRQQMDFIKWVRKTHPSTYNRLKKAHEGAMKND